MAQNLGDNQISTLRNSAHWRTHLYEVQKLGGGVPLRVSSHDREIWHEGVKWTPTAGRLSDAEIASGTSTGDTELVGAISPDTITPIDIQLGVYDDAEIRELIIDWRRPDKPAYVEQIWYIDELSGNGRVWRATLSTSARFLESRRGPIYTTSCQAVLGDERCKAVPAVYPATVQDVTDAQLEFESTLSVGNQLLRLGEVQWLTGNNQGRANRILANVATDGLVKLAVPTRFPIRTGDTFNAVQGCDGLALTCKGTFNNLENFRGNERQKNAKQLILSRGSVT